MVDRLMCGERVNLNPPSQASILKTALEIRRSDFLPGCQSVGELVNKMVSKGLDPVGVPVEVTELRAERAGLSKGIYLIDSLVEGFVNDNDLSKDFGKSFKVVYLKPFGENPMNVRHVVDINSNNFSFFGL